MKLLILYINKRKIMINKLKSSLNSKQWTQSQKERISSQINKLQIKSNNHVFVWQSGQIVTTRDLTKIVKKVVTINDINEPNRYTAYSLRIGGTSAASNANIPQPKILKFIGCAPSRLPNISMRYMRYTQDQLKLLPYEILHEALQQNNKQNITFDPWTFGYQNKS